MNKTVAQIYFFAVTTGGLTCVVRAADTPDQPLGHTLSMEQAKKIAIARNANLAAKREHIEASKAKQGRAAAGYYPSLESKLGSEQGLAGKSEQAATFGYLLARWNIYRGGLDVAATKTSALETKRAELEYETEHLAVENAVEEVFSKILYLRDVSQIKERFITLNVQQQALARQVVSRGGGSESDVVEFDLRAATLRSELAMIEQEYRGSLIRLKALIGEETAENPAPTGELPHQHLPQGSLAAYLSATLTETPRIKLSTLDLDVASHKVNASKGRWLPHVDLEGRFGSLPTSEGGEKGKLGSSVALVATWEIFGGFDTSYDVKESHAEKAKSDWQLKGDINTLLPDIEARMGELSTIEKRADLEKNNIRMAKKYYDLTFADFKRGYKNSGDFSAAAQTWYETEVQRKRLDLEFIEKKLALELQLGKRMATISMKDVDDHPGGQK